MRLVLRGVASNRDAIGARVTAQVDGATRRVQMVKTGSSYLSLCELPLTIGLGSAPSIARLEIVWPGGRVEHIAGAQPGRTLIIEEGRGVVRTEPFGTRSASPTAGSRR